MCCGIAVGSDKPHWSDNIMIPYERNIQYKNQIWTGNQHAWMSVTVDMPVLHYHCAVVPTWWVCHSAVPSCDRTMTQRTMASMNLAQNPDSTETNKQIKRSSSLINIFMKHAEVDVSGAFPFRCLIVSLSHFLMFAPCCCTFSAKLC